MRGAHLSNDVLGIFVDKSTLKKAQISRAGAALSSISRKNTVKVGESTYGLDQNKLGGKDIIKVTPKK